MKKLLVLIIFAVSCNDTINKERIFKKSTKSIGYISTQNQSRVPIFVYEIDECEYIGLIEGYQTDFFAHKGNCKFCKHRNR